MGPQLFIKLTNGKYLSFHKENICDYTVKNLKYEIFKKDKLPSTWQRFVYSGKSFVDNNLHLLNDLHIPHEGTIHLLLRWHGVGCQCGLCQYKMILRNNKIIKKPNYDNYKPKESCQNIHNTF